MNEKSGKQMQLSGTNLERAGDHNQRVTLHAIRVNGPITRAELYHRDEVNFPGTAAEVTPIRELDRIEIGAVSRGPITEKIQSAFFDIVNGRNPKYAHWLAKV